MTGLLPPNATALERAFDATIAARMGSWSVPFGVLKDPLRCPAWVLPYLAWELSVDTWESDWPEAQKRAVIAAALDVHRHKGTIGAVRAAVAAQGVAATVTEWWQTGDDPYTFGVEAETDQAMTPRKQAEILRAIAAAKNTRSHLSRARMVMRVSGATPVWAGLMMSGAVVEVYPLPPVEHRPAARSNRGATLYSLNSLTLYPQQAAA